MDDESDDSIDEMACSLQYEREKFAQQSEQLQSLKDENKVYKAVYKNAEEEIKEVEAFLESNIRSLQDLVDANRNALYKIRNIDTTVVNPSRTQSHSNDALALLPCFSQNGLGQHDVLEVQNEIKNRRKAEKDELKRMDSDYVRSLTRISEVALSEVTVHLTPLPNNIVNDHLSRHKFLEFSLGKFNPNHNSTPDCQIESLRLLDLVPTPTTPAKKITTNGNITTRRRRFNYSLGLDNGKQNRVESGDGEVTSANSTRKRLKRTPRSENSGQFNENDETGQRTLSDRPVRSRRPKNYKEVSAKTKLRRS